VSADESLDDAVRAMGHPGRRAMLRLARDEERTASELAEVAGLSPSAASPHLKVLRETGLMHVRVDAKRRLYRVDPGRLAGVRAALDELWGDRLDALKTRAEAGNDDARRRRRRSA
jgi:DNA-binding transcriptional ArsR family regulator